MVDSELAGQVRPFLAAGERRLAVAGPLGTLIPGGGLRRGATVTVDGVAGSGATTVALVLAAAATQAGEWAAIVDPYGTLGARAAADAGVELERCAVIRHCPADRWSTVVAALLDGVALVAATVPVRLRPSDARRLVAPRGSVRRCSSRSARGRSKHRCACTRKAARGPAWVTGAVRSTRAMLNVRVEAKGAPARGNVRALAG